MQYSCKKVLTRYKKSCIISIEGKEEVNKMKYMVKINKHKYGYEVVQSSL